MHNGPQPRPETEQWVAIGHQEPSDCPFTLRMMKGEEGRTGTHKVQVGTVWAGDGDACIMPSSKAVKLQLSPKSREQTCPTLPSPRLGLD